MTMVTHVEMDPGSNVIIFIWGRLILYTRVADSEKEVVGIGWDHQIGSNWQGF